MAPDPDPPVLRPLRPDDAEGAAALVRTAFAAQGTVTDPPSSALRETAVSLAAWIAAGGGIALADREALVALLLWAERDGGLYCGRLAVSPAARGRGLARRLMAEAEREARRRGLTHLHVKVRLSLADNLEFFATLGFRETGPDAHPGYAAPTFAVLKKRLDP